MTNCETPVPTRERYCLLGPPRAWSRFFCLALIALLVAPAITTSQPSSLSRLLGAGIEHDHSAELELQTIRDRTRLLPDDLAETKTERQWALEKLAEVRTYKAVNSESVGNQQSAVLRDRLAASKESLLKGLGELKKKPCKEAEATALAQSVEKIRFAAGEIVEVAYDLDLEQKITEWGALRRTTAKLSVDRGAAVNSCKLALAGDFASETARVAEAVEVELRERAEMRKRISETWADAETEVRAYLGELEKKIETKERKQDLRSQLPWMIGLLGGISVIAIAVVRLFPSVVMMEWVSSGQVIQFVTVMLLLSAILALGLAELLEGETVGTLLGGIGGYVLSQGVGRSAARRTLRELMDHPQERRSEPA